MIMKIAYFDCFAGIAGDMVLGAFLDCGVPLDELKKGLSSLPIADWDITATPVLKSGIHSLKVRVSHGGHSDDEELGARKAASFTHNHAHHSHNHAREHTHFQNETHHHVHYHGRSMAEIRALIEASDLSSRVQQTALDIFGRIATVEAELHHSTAEDVHFHEIGGLDSLLDICGTAWCLDYLGIDAVYCSALPYSTGTVECAHGTMPVPAPATLKLLRGVPMIPTGLTGEMITPTGAGILAALAQGFGDPPAFTPRAFGMGAGTRDWTDRPNLLRITIGETTDSMVNFDRTADDGLQWNTLSLLETNVDDMNPELWKHALERVFAAGALDAWLAPIQMKKNRPAQMFSALCTSEHRNEVLCAMLRETTTLGVRVSTVQRAALPRENATVLTPWGDVRMKVARWQKGGVLRGAPEWDDVARLARESEVSAPEIYAAAARAWQNEREQDGAVETNATVSPSRARLASSEAQSHQPHALAQQAQP